MVNTLVNRKPLKIHDNDNIFIPQNQNKENNPYQKTRRSLNANDSLSDISHRSKTVQINEVFFKNNLAKNILILCFNSKFFIGPESNSYLRSRAKSFK